MLNHLQRVSRISFKKSRAKRKGRTVCCVSQPEKLKIVFVGTELAPWSKVGGLGDVMNALPVALASQGHTVMTVVPRYDFYPDVKETGLIVSLKGRVRADSGKDQDDVRHARLHLCKKDGVDRVFVEHPSYFREKASATRRGNRCSCVYPYCPTISRTEFEVGCSVLCQSALYAPVLIWGAAPANHTLHSGLDVQKEVFSNLGARMLDANADGDLSVVDASQWDGLVFVCNDWPCGLLPLWMKRHASGEAVPDAKIDGGQLTVAGSHKTNLLYTLMDEEVQTERRIERRTPRPCTVPPETEADNLDDCLAQERTSRIPPAPRNGQMKEMPPSNRRSKTAIERSLAQLQTDVIQHAKVVFLIHNMEFAGPCIEHSINTLELQDHLGRSDPLNGRMTRIEDEKASWLDMGLVRSDSVLTVSPGYASELMSQLKKTDSPLLRNLNITGIMNGIDTDIWNPSDDPFLSPSMHYTSDNLTYGKRRAKVHLQRKLGMIVDAESPLFGFIGRLDHQKGVDVLLTSVLKFFSSPVHADGQFVLLGCGDVVLERHMRSIKYWFPGRAIGVTTFNEQRAHEILAASDFLVMPSRYEPCGLVALSALRYGAIPIAPAVGGLKDIVQADSVDDCPLGIEVAQALQAEYPLAESAQYLHAAFEEARQLHSTPEFEERQRQCMRTNVSWEKPAVRWHSHLTSLVHDRNSK